MKDFSFDDLKFSRMNDFSYFIRIFSPCLKEENFEFLRFEMLKNDRKNFEKFWLLRKISFF